MIISPATVSYRTLPANLIGDDLTLFEDALAEQIQEARLLTLKHINIGRHGILFKGWSIYNESITYHYRLRLHLDKFCIPALKFYLKFLIKDQLIKEKIFYGEEGDYLWIADQNTSAYFHWFGDAIPRLVAAKQIIERPKLLLPESYKKASYVGDVLPVFSIQDAIFIPENSICRINKLYVPTPIATPGNYNDALMRQIRKECREYFSGKLDVDRYLGDRIYLSRSKAVQRKIVNEDELIELLTRYGFKAITMEDFSFKEQVSIVFHAKCLISNHGAGLTNMLFMEADTAVLEFRHHGDAHNNCYFSLASALNIKYFYQTCQSDYSGNPPPRELQKKWSKQDYTLAELSNWEKYTHSNMIVDLKKLELNLDSMLKFA